MLRSALLAPLMALSLFFTTAASLTASPSAMAAEWLYTFRPGDTIWDLCLKYTNKRGCWQSLPPLNGVKNDRQIRPGFVLTFPVEWLKEVPKPVTVTFVSGDAQVRTLQGPDFIPLKDGDTLSIGSVITTGGNGNLNLRFGDGSSLIMEPNSELSLDTLSSADGYGIVDSRLRLNQGAVKTRVPKRQPASRFKITTPSAVAAVRGTEYRVSAIAGSTPSMRGEVFEGLVDVNTDQNKQAVPAGFGITARKGEALKEPKPLLPAPTFTHSNAPQLLPAEVTWEALVDATSYQLEVLQNNADEQLLERRRLTETNTAFEQLEVGCYTLRLRAIDLDQLQGLAREQTLCIAAPLPIAQLNDDGFVYQDRFHATLSWPHIEQAASYRVQIATDPSFNSPIEEREITEASIDLSGESPLYVRVQTVGDEGQVTAYSQAIEWKPQPNPWIAVSLYVLYGLLVF